MTEDKKKQPDVAEASTEETNTFRDVIPDKVKHPSTWITAALVTVSYTHLTLPTNVAV